MHPPPALPLLYKPSVPTGGLTEASPRHHRGVLSQKHRVKTADQPLQTSFAYIYPCSTVLRHKVMTKYYFEPLDKFFLTGFLLSAIHEHLANLPPWQLREKSILSKCSLGFSCGHPFKVSHFTHRWCSPFTLQHAHGACRVASCPGLPETGALVGHGPSVLKAGKSGTNQNKLVPAAGNGNEVYCLDA